MTPLSRAIWLLARLGAEAEREEAAGADEFGDQTAPAAGTTGEDAERASIVEACPVSSNAGG